MKIRIVSMILSVIIVVSLSVSCGKNGTGEESTVPETAYSVDSTTEAPDTEPQTVTEPEKETEPLTEPSTETEPETTDEETGPAPEDTGITALLPENSSEISYDLAKELLTVCTGGGKSQTVSLLNERGFELILAKNYEKAYSDRSHTCAYTVSRKETDGKRLYLITIRGTSGGEWYSNMDIAPSHKNDTQYAENFMLCAQDIYLSVKDMIDSDENSSVIVCGHSRGAAAANLLGVLFDEVYDRSRVYVYTFATPATVRGDAAEKEYENIFNFINDNDMVTHLPPVEYGFSRAGKDIMLPVDKTEIKLLEFMSALFTLAPDIDSYYNKKYSLTSQGTGDDGLSVFDIMSMLAGSLSGGAAQLASLKDIAPESDLFKAAAAIGGLSAGLAANMGLEHMPSRYMTLIEQLEG